MVISQIDWEVVSCRYGRVAAHIYSVVVPFYASVSLNQQILSAHRFRQYWSFLFTSVYTLI